ncbi:complex I NDUFA9 subunit family protein [Candidatus Pelagibacter sp.]|nr:complex I NDUFA9 subunit family protein [Candidatus Pelagibacter sp.]
MKPKNCLIFGASGQIGRHLIRKLTKNNYKVTAVTRNLHQRGYILKTQASAGWIECIEANIFDEKKLRDLVSSADICINMIGILYEKSSSNSFQTIHSSFPYLLSKICKEFNVEQFIQLSSLGIDKAKDSNYAKSKLEGEINIKNNFSKSVILRPSVVYSVDDNFTTSLMTLLSRMPIFPIYYNGSTKFMPIHVSDLTEIIFQVIDKKMNSMIIECVGSEIITFKEILKKLLRLIDKKRIIVPLPLIVARLSSKVLQKLPKPLITEDQLRLLAYDNIPSGDYKTNFDIGISSKSTFDEEVKKYCFMWREAGQFSTDRYAKN